MRYFHGGNKGLRVGEFVLPATATGARSTSDIIVNNVHRRDRVYITPDMAAASLYAAVHGSPTIYEVSPEGDLEPDPDCFAPGLSCACPKAKVVAVHKVPGKIIKKARAAILRG